MTESYYLNMKTSMYTPTMKMSDLLEELDFQDADVAVATRRQPVLFLEAVRFRIAAMKAKIEAESALGVIKSSKAMKIRDEAARAGNRVTENAVNEALQMNSKYREAEKAVTDAELAEEYSKLLLEAFRQRRDALRIIGDLEGAEAAVGNLMADQGLKDVKKKLKERYRGA